MATAERNDEAPNSAPVGAMGSLLRRLDMLPFTDDNGGSISELKDYIYSIADKLKKLLELQDPPLTVIYWMKHARELSYDIEAYLDGLDSQTEDSINDPDAKEGDDTDDSYAKMKDCIDNSDEKMEYSVNDSHAEMEDNPDDSDDETEETVDNSDSSTQDSFCSSDYKISGLRTRAKGMIDRFEKFSLDSILSCPTAATTIVSPRPCRDVVLVGMGNQITKLISLLQPKDDNDNQLKIVSILGDEGIGKSTLIQEIWHESFKEQKIWPEPHSEIKRAFVQMGTKPDVRMILRSILSQVSLQEPSKDSGVTNLIQEIRRHLEQKRYFIIVDDVRSLSVWDVVGRAFPSCTFGSRVITTTSDEEVALACCSYLLEHNYVMESLSVVDCTELFIRTVVGSRTVNLQLSNDVSDEIKRTCGGLPLATMWTAILVASLPEIEETLCQLETEQGLSKMEKEENLNSDVKKFLAKNMRTESTPVEILNQVLKLYYNSLPDYLKTCLLYLSLYPENYYFLKEDLVKLWMAEGFICTSEEDKVEAAGRYFDVLVSLGLIQRTNINSNKQHQQGELVEDEGEEYPLRVPFVIHPTVFDFITTKSIEDNFITVMHYPELTVAFREKIRRLSLHFGSATYASTPESIGLSNVRTLSFMGLWSCMPSLVEFKLVRVLILNLCDDDGDKFPLADICKLLLLKYLHVRCNVAIKLPGQIGCLKHLETLEINSVVTAIPSDVFQLSRLLHLRLGLKQYPTLGLVAASNAISSDKFLPPLNDSSSTASPSVQIIELLLPICIFSRLPKWIPQLHKLCILEIVVRELLTTDIDMLADMPALTALSLYVKIPTAGNIAFRRGAFPALEYFRFMCGVLSLDFQKEAMPNLRQLMIGFNVGRREKCDNILAGIQHLLNLHEVVASIGVTMGTEETERIAAESALKDAIYKHPYPTKFIVKRVHHVEEEYRPPPFDPLSINEQEEVPVIHGLQTEDSTNLDMVPGKDTHEQANIRFTHSQRDKMVDYNKVIETAAGGNLGLLVTKLASLTLNEISELKAISGNIDWLKEELEILHAVLLDLSNEENPTHQQKVWKNRVRELSYDMEDAIDEFELAAKKSSAIYEAGTSNFVDRAVQSVQSCIERIKRLPSDYVINQKIQSLKSRVDLSEERHKRLKTGRETEGTSNDAFAIRDLAQYAHPADLVGIDAPRDDIIGMLDKGERRMVVAIVGFGGLGKTTLAKQVFDKIIADAGTGTGSFTSKAFVTVSRNPDIKKIMIDIMVDFKLTDKPGELKQLDPRQLTDKLREYTKEKRYLVVVDDVWSVDHWKSIEAALYDNNLGSRIIVTTRKNDVAEKCRRSKNGDVYRLDPLGDVEAEQLFIANAFFHKGCPPNLDEIFHKVLKKCGGSPLAILTLSGLLANKETQDQWEWVLDSLNYAVEGEDSDVSLVRKILSFSYFDLPQHLRTCLLYMSVFPEDAVIKRKRLVNRWIAQGFISTEGRSKTETGEHYFNELISRCLIQPVNIKYDGRARACKVHDTILDFIKHKSKEENLVAFLGDTEEGSQKNKARHLSIQDLENFTRLAEAERARSLTASGRNDKMVFYDCFSRLTCLRVLDLADFYTPSEAAHPDSVIDVSRLFHLKYLATGCISAKSIQGFINLQYLETLDLRLCSLKEFPRDIYELQHLVRLFIEPDTYLILPSGIGKMKALEELKHIDMEHSSLEFLQELGCLAKLRSVSVYLVADSERDQQKDLLLINSLRKLGMDGKNYLKSLTLTLIALDDFDDGVALDVSNDISWREALLNIRKLKMNVGVSLTKVPRWMGTLNHLEKLQLWVVDMRQEDLDTLGELRRLLYLVLQFDDYPAEGLTFGGTTTFQCLKYLMIPCYISSTKLVFGSLPRLQHLHILLRGNPLEVFSNDDELPPPGFYFDIRHLHSLTRADVEIIHGSMYPGEELKAEAGTNIIRDAVNALTNKPKLEIL